MRRCVDHADPIQLFLDARQRAVSAGTGFDGTAAVLATATLDGRPSVRWVLVKEVAADGFAVYTNYGSRKGLELDANPRAALAMHWPEIGEQFRIEGSVYRLPAERSDAYFGSRPRESQIGAWASDQTQPIDSRDVLVDRAAAYEAQYADAAVPRPPHWGGYLVVPSRIERWVSRPARLHDRWLFERTENSDWKVCRLAP